MSGGSQVLSARTTRFPLAIAAGAVVAVLALGAARPALAQGDPPDAGGAAADTLAAAADTLATAADTLAASAADTVLTLEQRLARIDARIAAMTDSLLAEGISATIVEQELRKRRERMERDARLAYQTESGASVPLFDNCTNRPEAGVQANVTKVNYFARLANEVDVKGGGSIRDSYGISYDSYRRQNKTVENRNADATYDGGQALPFRLKLDTSIDWSEDITTNNAGITNVNRRERRRAGATASRGGLATGPTTHSLQAAWFYNEQNAVNQGQADDFSEGEYSGAWRTTSQVAEGVKFSTSVFGLKRDGENLLAGIVSPSSTTGDTLAAALGYDRLGVRGYVSVDRASFERRYLDYRRNANGLIDTTDPDLPKVVQELEQKDALKLTWNNQTRIGRVRLTANLGHTFDTQEYAVSLVGRKERLRDNMALKMAFPVGADSFAVAYDYEWSWDDQIYGDSSAPRGKQYQKKREFTLDWQRDLFANTGITGRYRTELVQDIAENEFNNNDRDRLTEEARLKIDSSWRGRFNASLLGEYLRIEDISIRGTRSANNNIKRTFEVSPSYTWFVSEDVEFAQTFRMYIQYQDYPFGGREDVNKDDTFNKRGNLSSRVRWYPSERLTVEIKHDFNQRYNGTRTDTDGAGNALYRRDQDQTINRIELALEWDVVAWTKTESLTLEAATYRARDLIERFGAGGVNQTERYSGEMWLGAVLNKTWGQQNPLGVKGRVKRYFAYGPNVTDTSDDYWDADVLVSWSF